MLFYVSFEVNVAKAAVTSGRLSASMTLSRHALCQHFGIMKR
jgi:hypothetical protein